MFFFFCVVASAGAQYVAEVRSVVTAELRSNLPTTPIGKEPSILVDGQPAMTQGLLRFDLATIQNFQSASVKLFTINPSSSGTFTFWRKFR